MKTAKSNRLIKLEAGEGKVITTRIPSELRVKLLYTSVEKKDNYIEVDEQSEIELPYEPNIEEPEEILDGLTLKEAYYKLINENRVLQEENKLQNELIDITMMATDEMYMMLEPILDTMPQKARMTSKMVDLYVAMCQRGLKTIEEIPSKYRKQVEEALKQLEN